MMLRRSTIVLALAVVNSTACSSLSDEDQLRLISFKQNSKILYEDEQFRQAADQCRKGLLLDPDDLSLNQTLAYSLLRQRDPTQLLEAEQVFRRCLEIDDGDLRNRLGLAEVLFQLGVVYDGMLAGLDANEGITPRERVEKTKRLRELQRECFRESEEILIEVTQTPEGRDNVWAQNTLARLYAYGERYDEASDVLRRLIASLQNSLKFRRQQVDPETLSPEYRARFEQDLDRLERQVAEALHFAATVASKRGRFDEVVAAYAQLEALGRLDPADHYNRAVAYDELGARAAAIADYERFQSLAARLGVAFSENVHRAMRRASELRAGRPTRREMRELDPDSNRAPSSAADAALDADVATPDDRTHPGG